LLVSPPEITTFRPVIEGSGEDAIDRLPEGQAVVQHVPDVQQVVRDGQQVVPNVQHIVPDVQHVVPATQHGPG
jgi:hypothetical protein